MASSTMYERVGGTAFFEQLTSRFYDAVATDPVLRPLYPEDDARLERARRHLCAFLVQQWGGPATYREERGEPRLGKRHLPFRIGPAERDAWLGHMTAAVKAGGLSPLDETQMLHFFAGVARSLVNQPED